LRGKREEKLADDSQRYQKQTRPDTRIQKQNPPAKLCANQLPPVYAKSMPDEIQIFKFINKKRKTNQTKLPSGLTSSYYPPPHALSLTAVPNTDWYPCKQSWKHLPAEYCHVRPGTSSQTPAPPSHGDRPPHLRGSNLLAGFLLSSRGSLS